MGIKLVSVPLIPPKKLTRADLKSRVVDGKVSFKE